MWLWISTVRFAVAAGVCFCGQVRSALPAPPFFLGGWALLDPSAPALTPVCPSSPRRCAVHVWFPRPVCFCCHLLQISGVFLIDAKGDIVISRLYR